MTEHDGAARKDRFRQSLRWLHQGRVEEAIDLLEPLHEAQPDDPEIALNLGGAYVLQKRYDEAQAVLEQAAEQAPGNANVWINLAAARLGPLEESDEAQQDAAIQAYEQALAADPDAANVHYMLGLLYRARDDTLRAVAHFARALEQNPDDDDARRMLAAITAQSGPT